MFYFKNYQIMFFILLFTILTVKCSGNLYTICTGESPNTIPGTCMTRGQCLLNSGTVSGSCELGSGVCCIKSITCDQTSSLKRTFIVRQADSFHATTCNYNIKPYSNRVCQLRIDFIHLALEFLPDEPMQCSTESFSIDDNGKNIMLCGRNIDQHIYVGFNATENMNIVKKIMLKFNERSQSTWQLIVTQLECPQGSAHPGRSLQTFLESLNDGDLKRTNSERIQARLSYNPRISYEDMHLLAPSGCLQYFPDSKGVVKSFNFDNTRDMGYPVDMNYAICFRRTNPNDQLTLTSDSFKIGSTTGNDFGETCVPANTIQDELKDHMVIPKGIFTVGTDNSVNSYFCGAFDDLKIKYLAPGPFIMYFFSDSETNAEEIGFSFNYVIN